MNWADAYERISGTLKDEREAHAKTVTRNAIELGGARVRIAQLEGELVRVRLISVLRGKIAEAWSEMLRESDAELARVKDELAEVLVNMEEAW